MVSAARLLRPTIFLAGVVLLSSCHREKSDTATPGTANASPGASTNDTSSLFVTPPTNSAPAQTLPLRATLSPEEQILRQAAQLDAQGHPDTALEKVNSVLQSNPKSTDALSMRGQIYAEMKNWDQATQAYEAIVQIDPKNVPAQLNLCELKFKQGAYDEARVGFAALQSDPDYGDFASFKVFLCDLFAGHEDVAKKELDAFNAAGSNPSFYFSNTAWDIYHKQIDDARHWLVSGLRIYAPEKIYLYTSSLKDMGYLPLPPPAPPQ